MKVTVVDRQAMAAAWGHGLYTILTRTLEISDTCPVCGGPRGTPRNHHMYEDGDTATVSVWDNPCGHVDKYSAVLGENHASPT